MAEFFKFTSAPDLNKFIVPVTPHPSVLEIVDSWSLILELSWSLNKVKSIFGVQNKLLDRLLTSDADNFSVADFKFKFLFFKVKKILWKRVVQF